MNIEYFIPESVDITKLEHHVQTFIDKDTVIDLNLGGFIATQKSDYIQFRPTPIGVGGFITYVYNFTDKPIYMLDGDNRINILEPQKPDSRYVESGVSCIVIDIINNNQDVDVTDKSKRFLMERRKALAGLDLNLPAFNNYSDSANMDYLTKAKCNQRLRYTLIDPVDEMVKRGGAMFVRDAGIVIGMVDYAHRIAIHPKSDRELLLKATPRLAAVDSLGLNISVNDIEHRYDKAFINVGGDVVEVPVTRNPLFSNGIYYWKNIFDNDSIPSRYDIESKENPIQIFSSISEAESGGSPEKMIEREISQTKLQMQQEKIAHEQEAARRSIEAQRQQVNLDRERLEHDARERQREFERRQKTARDNERVENVSFVRKALVEGVKAIAAVATTAALFFGWYAKKKATNP